MKIGRANRQRGLRLSRVGCAASGGAAPDVIRRLRLCNQAITWLWFSSGANQSVGNQIEEPQLVHSAQVNVGRVFEDEAADILLVDQVAVAVLLWASCCAAEFGFQMSALDPASYCMRIDPQRLRKTVGGVEAPVMLESHPLQLEVDSGHGARVSGSLQLQTDSLVAHPRMPRQNA